jgi:hypothetical protein
MGVAVGVKVKVWVGLRVGARVMVGVMDGAGSWVGVKDGVGVRGSTGRDSAVAGATGSELTTGLQPVTANIRKKQVKIDDRISWLRNLFFCIEHFQDTPPLQAFRCAVTSRRGWSRHSVWQVSVQITPLIHHFGAFCKAGSKYTTNYEGVD